MIKAGKSYDEVYHSFAWEIPQHYNIALDICDKWAKDKTRTALIWEDGGGQVRSYTFARLKELSDRLGNALKAQGIGKGDRVGILLPQCPETALTHIAVFKLGGVSIPLFTLFGVDALSYRLENSGAKAVVTDQANLPKILQVRDQLPALETVIVTGGERPEGVLGFDGLISQASPQLTPVATLAEDPALIIYTSGTTGPPKGALHAHRTLLGHLPGVEFPHNFFPQRGDLFWTPADWAWIGGLIDVLFPAWHHGVPVVAHRFKKFDPEGAFALIARHGIKNSFMPPTALKLMRQVKDPKTRFGFDMRSIASAGEPLGAELLHWGREELGITINEFYGQTEVNLVVACCHEIMEVLPGSMGKPVPGHVVEVIDQEGRLLPPGEVGEIAVKAPNPVMFLEYWDRPQATRDKYLGDWCLTGDLGRKDQEGYLWFKGRTDDLITSAGYRIGPAEIEDCLLKHKAVALAAAVGVPDLQRTESIKAFLVLKPGFMPTGELAEEIKGFVKTRLAAHEYPRAIEFRQELPLTATGKIIRRKLRQEEMNNQEKNEA